MCLTIKGQIAAVIIEPARIGRKPVSARTIWENSFELAAMKRLKMKQKITCADMVSMKRIFLSMSRKKYVKVYTKGRYPGFAQVNA
jgi:hypothetical protein